jgi:hypothetical protein
MIHEHRENTQTAKAKPLQRYVIQVRLYEVKTDFLHMS